MASTPRASGFWSVPSMSSSYFPDEDAEDVEQQQQLIAENDLDEDMRTPLDKTIDRIGMGSYQWTLLSLCGFGWMADNMWIQAVAIILPRVQQHYSIPDNYIGTVSSSMFAGMMFGALGWGTCSDLMGRSTAFNATLFFTSVFGLLASLANSFLSLCILLFLLGSAVGGSMPTDGTLLLEHMPHGKKYLVTALSVFFSFGAVLAAVVALLVVPQNSCSGTALECDVGSQNQGWKYLLITLGLITLSMFVARMVFFRLHESPRYLVHAGRHQEALESLQMISKFNGSDLSIALEDVDDTHCQAEGSPVQETDPARVPFLAQKSDDPQPTSTTIFDADGAEDDSQSSMQRQSSTSSNSLNSGRPDGVAHYHSTGESPTPLDSHVFMTPTHEHHQPNMLASATSPIQKEDNQLSEAPAPLRRPPRTRASSRLSTSSLAGRRISSIYENKVCGALPRWLRRPLWAWWDRVMMVLAPEWLRTTILVWGAWWSMSLAYTMFNVFLPKLLETGSGADGPLVPKTLEESLWDVVIFTIGGCPGAILGAYMVESSLGRRWSLAASTFVTAFFCVVFVLVQSSWAVRASTVGISLSATTMWAILYGWTPEIFGTKVRGTACGIASALSRIGGMIAPMLGGVLLMIDRSVPVYTSVVVFVFAGFCVLLLREGPASSKGERVIVH